MMKFTYKNTVAAILHQGLLLCILIAPVLLSGYRGPIRKVITDALDSSVEQALFRAELKQELLPVAETQIRMLSSAGYRNQTGTHGNFILNHGTEHMPNKSETDVPLICADYYYVESLIRMRNLLHNLGSNKSAKTLSVRI